MDYETLALSRLTNFFQDKPRVKSLVGALPRQLDIFEAVANQVKNERAIDTAIGIQLDKLGDIVGEKRRGRDDDTYRKAITFRVFVNISKGRPSDLIGSTRTLTQADDVQYIESYPATAYLFSNGYDADSTIQVQIQDVSPAAICDVPITVSYGEEPLRMSNVDILDDIQSELGGVQLGVFVTLARKRLKTLSGHRLRIRQDYQVLPSSTVLNGVFQP